jgi:hypothetical protein
MAENISTINYSRITHLASPLNVVKLSIAKSRPLGIPARRETTFYAKQTQFAKYSNERKRSDDKGIWKFSPPQIRRKQTQSNPISNPNKPRFIPEGLVHLMLVKGHSRHDNHHNDTYGESANDHQIV